MSLRFSSISWKSYILRSIQIVVSLVLSSPHGLLLSMMLVIITFLLTISIFPYLSWQKQGICPWKQIPSIGIYQNIYWHPWITSQHQKYNIRNLKKQIQTTLEKQFQLSKRKTKLARGIFWCNIIFTFNKSNSKYHSNEVEGSHK